MAVQVIGDDVVAAKLRAAAVRVKSQQKMMLWDSAEVLQEAIQANISKQGLVKSGELISSGRTFGLSAGGINVGFGKGVVGESGSPYAWALEVGAGWHFIEGNPYLAFEWEKSDDGWFVGPLVWHPGVRPYRFVRHGSEEAMIPIALLVKDYLFAALEIA